MACYNSDTHEWILIFFGRNVTDKVGNQKTFHYSTSNNFMLLHYEAKRGIMKIIFFTQLDCVTRKIHLYADFRKENVVTCDVFDSV